MSHVPPSNSSGSSSSTVDLPLFLVWFSRSAKATAEIKIDRTPSQSGVISAVVL